MMKRVIVIGCPGSGKSTLSIELSEITGLPLYHLDMMYWNSDRTTIEKTVFVNRLEQVLKEDEWIIDGNYASTMEMRISACDTVIFLDYPTDVCVEGVISRRGKSRQDIPWIEPENQEDLEFMEFIRGYNETSKPKVIRFLEKYKTKNIIILTSRHEAEMFLRNQTVFHSREYGS